MRISLIVLLSLSFVAAHAVPAARKGCRKKLKNLNIRIREGNLIDLTHVFDDRSAYWPSHEEGFRLINFFKGFVTSPFRFFYSTNTLSSPEHAGTHMDAPNHFAEGSHAVDEVSLYSLFGQGVLLNLAKDGERFGPDSLVTIDHFLEWEKEHGRIRTGSIVLVRTGYGEIYYDREKYLGTNLTGSAAVPQLHFPGYDPECAEWLVKQRCVAAIGIDTPSTDYGQSKDFRTHRVLAERNIPAFENVANLQLLSERNREFNVIALPMNVKGGTGAATRVVAALS